MKLNTGFCIQETEFLKQQLIKGSDNDENDNGSRNDYFPRSLQNQFYWIHMQVTRSGYTAR